MSWIENLAGELATVTDRDVYQHYRDVYGRHASRQLAADMGVSQRTARRALSGAAGVRQFTKGDTFAEAKADQVSARIEDQLSAVDVGQVEVFYAGTSAGTRNIGLQDLSDHPALPTIRQALQEGDQARAADLIGGAVMDVYGAPMLTLGGS